MANSSPPSRAIVSASRSVARRRGAASTRSRSPLAWPSVSLISLKRSRSITITATPASSRCGATDHLSDAILEQDTVGQLGERIVQRLVAVELSLLAQRGLGAVAVLLGQHLLGDVEQNAVQP